MSEEISTKLGKLKLKEEQDELARADTILHETRDDSLGMNVSPKAFDHRLNLEERFLDHGEMSRGGMATIRKVLERNLSRQVAMKVMRTDSEISEERRYRFIKEAQITGQLEHPNIVPVYELGADDRGVHFFTMKLVRGKTLSEFVAETRQSSPNDYLYEAMQVFIKVCDALAFAHDNGVIHRDIKPSNIMVGAHGQVYLMDWGVAYLKRTEFAPDDSQKLADTLEQRRDLPGTLLGTYSYMSPEQAHGLVDCIDERSDVFSLGGVLYYILTGQAPYSGETKAEVLEHAQQCKFPPPEEANDSCPSPVLSQVAMKAMAPDPVDRYQRVEDFKRDMEAVLRGRGRYPVVRIAAGEVILKEGEAGDEAYVIRSGKCEVYRTVDGRRMHISTLGPGEFFGETAVFTNEPRTASIRATDEVELWVVAGRAIKKELKLDTWMGGFVSVMGQRFSERSDTVTRLRAELAREQILREILLHIARHGLVNQIGERTLSWDEIFEAIGKPFRCERAFLLEIIESDPIFRVDREGDRVKTIALVT